MRLLCPQCKEAYHPYSEEVDAFVSDSDDIRAVAIRSGMRSFSANAFDKVSQGVTSLEEVKPYLF